MPALSSQQIAQFNEEGFLVVNDILDLEKDIQPLVSEYTQLLDDLCEVWLEQGLISETYAELPFEARLVELFKRGCDYASYMDISLPLGSVKADSPIHLGDEVFKLITNPRLVSAVESLIGTEIYSNPIQHVRIKPPVKHIPERDDVSSLLTKTVWHQDQAVALPEADDSQVLTVWLAVTDATVENGCLQVVKGSHREDLTMHCPNRGPFYIPDALIREEAVVATPVKKGGAVIMHSRLQHSSLDNTSEHFRWSFDLRYNPVGQATGRSVFPGFVVQSQKHPEQVIRKSADWAKLWLDTRERLAQKEDLNLNRWGHINSELCA